MSDETTPQDDAAMSPASAGSVAERPLGDPEIALELLKLRVAELEKRLVRLPPLDPNGAPGWNAAIGAAREALAEAGVDWDTEWPQSAKGDLMQWIDRTDREPSKDGWYLVCDMETAPYLPDRAEFESGQWSPVSGDKEFVITHWMELPPPPFEVNWDDD